MRMKKLLVSAMVLVSAALGTQGALGASVDKRVEACVARCVDIGGYHPVQCKQTCEEEAERRAEEED